MGKVHLPDFLQQRLQPKKGKVVEVPIDSVAYANGHDSDDLKSVTAPYIYHPEIGKEIGEHNGAHYYTIGQRKGLNIGGYSKPLFVIGTSTEDNVIYMGMGEDHPGLYRKGLFVPNQDEHWIREDLRLSIGDSARYLARIRYRQQLSPCTLFKKEEGLYIIFDQPMKSITPGQFAAWYDGEELIGSGVIN